MNRRIRRWVSIALLGFLAFSQASLALAGCAMDRAAMARMMTTQADHNCCEEAISPCGDDAAPMSVNACVLQSTSDLQVPASVPVAISAGSAVVSFVPQSRPPVPISRRFEPPGANVPSRILLHSFLV